MTKIRPVVRRRLADMVTPVGLYLRLRDHFQNPVLLESNDFRSAENCFSFIGLDPLAGFEVRGGQVEITLPSQPPQVFPLGGEADVAELFAQFAAQIEVEKPAATDLKITNGFFGFTTFDAVQHFDSVQFDPAKRRLDLPDICYRFYRFVIGIDHFREEMYLLENLPEGQTSRLHEVENLLENHSVGAFQFGRDGAETSNMTDAEFMELVRLGKHHCQQGDVFQIVFSRQFRQRFRGDEFNVYRALRSVNPSPYLFFFDYGNFKIFGSSPEAQLVVKNGTASVNPIAGTYRRTGDDAEDARRAEALLADPKENAEHVMLVDLARNDLGRHAAAVEVRTLREVQFFSHVIHLVSKVEGRLRPGTNPFRVFADTFPAGTLSGAPKFRALQLIGQHENQSRSFYGGTIGFIGLDGSMNQAILIRSFLSMGGALHFQAGAGVVVSSVEMPELQEVNNKIGALRRALELAEGIGLPNG